MTYTQTLYKILSDHIKPKIIKRNNRYKKWKYGYDQENDIVVISKSGQIGEIYEIQGLKIALPLEEKTYKRANKKEEQYWEVFDYPKSLERLKTVFDWNNTSLDFKDKWYDYIDEEFKRREEGFWFYNKGVSTYITGSHYMYLQWTKIDVGKPEFRESNRLFFIFWEACKSDTRCYGMCYLKNRRSGFLSWHPQNWYTRPLYPQIHDMEYYLKLELMRKRCLLTKWYQYQLTIPSFSNRSRTVWTAPRPSSHIESLPRNLPEKNWKITQPLKRNSRAWTQPSIGRIPVTTPMMGRNSNSSRTMNRGNGRGPIISSTTGGSRKQR